MADLRRSSDEILARRGIAVSLGGAEHRVGRLVIEQNRTWKERLQREAAGRWGAMGASATWSDVIGTFAGLTDLQIDLIVAYDEAHDESGRATRPGVLGGREFIEANADEEEVYEAFKLIAAAAFPFLRDAARFPTLVIQLLAQIQQSSTSAPLPTGDSGPSGSSAS